MIDTHVAISLFSGQVQHLSKQAQRLLETSPRRLSPIVILELEMLSEIGRVKSNPRTIIDFLKRELDIQESMERLSEVIRHALPLQFTRDPFDRLIVAHADLLNAPLITFDARLLEHYARALD